MKILFETVFFFLLFMSPVIIVGYMSYKKEYEFHNSDIETTGTVMRIKTITKHSREIHNYGSSSERFSEHTYHLYYPVIDFEHNGLNYECESLMPYSEHACPFPGTTVKIAVNEDFSKVKILREVK